MVESGVGRIRIGPNAMLMRSSCPSRRTSCVARYVDPAAGRISFSQYAETWLRTRAFDESTPESTEFRVRKHLLPFFGHRSLGSIRPGHVSEWDRGMVGKLALVDEVGAVRAPAAHLPGRRG